MLIISFPGHDIDASMYQIVATSATKLINPLYAGLFIYCTSYHSSIINVDMMKPIGWSD